MSRRAVLTTAAALVIGGSAVPALAGGLASATPGEDRTHVCVLTQYDPKTGKRDGVCVWVPVKPPLSVVDGAAR